MSQRNTISASKGKLFHLALKTVIRMSILRHGWTTLVGGIVPRQWEKCGQCRCCGACCDFPTIAVPRIYFRSPLLIKAVIAWHESWYGFAIDHVNPDSGLIVFTCRHLTSERRCDNYDDRPRMCRTYPEIRTWYVKPDFFPTCGFIPVRTAEVEIKREVDAFLERNAALLSPDRLSGSSEGSMTAAISKVHKKTPPPEGSGVG